MNTLQHAFRNCDTSKLANLFYSMYVKERKEETPDLKCIEQLIEELKSAEAKGREDGWVILISGPHEDSSKACVAYGALRYKKSAFAASYPIDRVPGDELQRMGTDELSTLLDRLRAVPTPESGSFYNESALWVLGYDLPDAVIETYGLEKALSIILYEMTWFGWSLEEMETEKDRFLNDPKAPICDEFYRHEHERMGPDEEQFPEEQEEPLARSPEEEEEQKRRELLAAVKNCYRFLQLADRVAKETYQE